MRILTAKIVRKAVIRANKSNLNLNIVLSRRRSRKHELNIYSFFIHISYAVFCLKKKNDLGADAVRRPPPAGGTAAADRRAHSGADFDGGLTLRSRRETSAGERPA